MPTVQDFLDILQQTTPEQLAEDWDNIGLLVGDPNQNIDRVLLALDPCHSLLDRARAGRYDLILTHHPPIFRALKAVRTDTPVGGFIAGAIRQGLSVIACHTNLDAMEEGVSTVLATALGLTQSSPLVATRTGCGNNSGLGRIGAYPTPLSAQDFLNRVRRACAPPWILEAGPRPSQVTTVAVCGGSCSDFSEIALHRKADVFVTAEVKHSVARWAEDAGLWILDAGHFATEQPVLAFFRDLLQQQCLQRGWKIAIDTADQQSPLRLV
ncbi:Nif3-like dinuclear metal center hexameric protein [Desulfobulbus alkaliphilus]|uniref:Nif3-like dinuclear metal center hexameric protein n=1 Tax=Desulfobulbus alkaliphilus TaxID=869814 RepID=UPI0019657EE4|nr:Nif3-like dinuclear metal center hexameric protein [Desulfobulbus alkaliphilus]